MRRPRRASEQRIVCWIILPRRSSWRISRRASPNWNGQQPCRGPDKIMLLKRRIADLERTWPRRRSLSELLRETDSVVRLTGISFYEAFDSLLAGVTGEEVAR